MPDEPVEQKVVTAIAVSVNHAGSDLHAQRVNDAINAEILKCNAEGINTDEKNSAVIRERMHAARVRELERINLEEEQRTLLS